jgi:hypothetical protein
MNARANQSMLLTVAILALSLLAGCASKMVPFTHELRTQYDLQDEDVRSLQFYVSHTVKLRRELESTGTRISGGTLKLQSGKLIEEIVIEDKTPGIALDVNRDALLVSFEEGSALGFVLRGAEPAPSGPLRIESTGGFAEPPNAFPGDSIERPREPLANLIGSYFLDTDTSGAMVTFQGRVWEAVEGSLQAHLMIDAEELEDVSESHTVLKGRRLSRGKVRVITF